MSKKINTKLMHRIMLAVFLGMAFSIFAAVPVFGQSAEVATGDEARQQIDALQAQAQSLQKEIDGFNHDLEIVVEKHNETRVELDKLTHDLADSRSRLDAMLTEQYAQEKLLTDRLKALYKAGDINFLNILLNSSSLTDFFEQTRYIAKINEQDAKLQAQYESRANEISYLTEEIDHKRSSQMRLESELAQQEDQIEARLAERQGMLDQVDTQVKQILEQEAQRQRVEQARIAAEQQALMKELQITDAVQAQVVQTALQFLGVPYVWGGESPAGFDCSGLTKYVFAQHGVALPHYAASQFTMGVPVPDDQLQPGDLLFWGPGHPHHVAMYIGNGRYVEAPTFGEVVKISTLDVDDGDYAGARRYPLRAKSL